MSSNAENRRQRANAASIHRASAARARLRQMNTTQWRALFDYARGRAWWVPLATHRALVARGCVTDSGTVTRKGYDCLKGKRGDPVFDKPAAEVRAYYLALHDAPAWPTEAA